MLINTLGRNCAGQQFEQTSTTASTQIESFTWRYFLRKGIQPESSQPFQCQHISNSQVVLCISSKPSMASSLGNTKRNFQINGPQYIWRQKSPFFLVILFFLKLQSDHKKGVYSQISTFPAFLPITTRNPTPKTP